MRQKPPAALLEDDEKWCRHCQTAVPGFYTTGARCKGCASRATHSAHVQKVYGISGAEYDELLKMQGHRCAICRQKPAKKRLAVDHDHKTGEVRGLLCATCNKGILGSAHDSLEILQRAVGYMESPPARELTRSS